jgi:hypothetical protein
MNEYGRGVVAARVAAERASRSGGDGACALSSGAGAPALCAAGASAGGAGGASGARSVASAVCALLGAAAFASALGGQCCGGTCEFFSAGCTSLRCMVGVGATGVSSAAGAGGGGARDAAATATARRTDGGDTPRDDSDAEVEDGGGYDSGSDDVMSDVEDGAGEDSGGGSGDGGRAAAARWLCGVDPDRAHPFEEARARKDVSQAVAFAALSPQKRARAEAQRAERARTVKVARSVRAGVMGVVLRERRACDVGAEATARKAGVSALAESGRLVEEARRAVTFDERSAAARPSDAMRVALEQQQEGRRLSEALAAAELAELKARVAAHEAAIDKETAELLDDAALDDGHLIAGLCDISMARQRSAALELRRARETVLLLEEQSSGR